MIHRLLLRVKRLDIPDTFCILLNTTVAAKETHPRHTSDALLEPGVLVFVGLVHKGVGLDVAVEVIADEIIITLIDDRVAKGAESAGIAKTPAFDGVKDLSEIRVKFEGAIVMSMAEIFNVFGQVAEEEDVIFADFASDFDLYQG